MTEEKSASKQTGSKLPLPPNRHETAKALYRMQIYRRKETQILRFIVSDVVKLISRQLTSQISPYTYITSYLHFFILSANTYIKPYSPHIN